VLPHQVVVTDAENVNPIHWRPFPAVVHPLGLPPQLYANQGDDNPDHPDRQTCNLAGSVGHYRCSPGRPCRQPSAAEEIQITPQCTLPVSETNGHGRDVFSWDEDNGGWLEQDNAAATDAAAAAPLWQQRNLDDQLEAPASHAVSPQSVHSYMPALETAPPLPPQQQNLLDPIPPHHAWDWEVRVRDDAPLPTVDQMVLWNAQAVHVPTGGGRELFPPIPYRQTMLFSVFRPLREYISRTTRPLLLVQ
jgi:hypothetical protein